MSVAYVVTRDVEGKEIERVGFIGPFARWRAKRWLDRQIPAPQPVAGLGPMWTSRVETDPDNDRALRDR